MNNMLLRLLVLGLLSVVLSMKCPRTQVWKDCEQVCPPSCDSMYYERKCPCEPGCGCPKDYIFKTDGSSTCIPRRRCYSYCPENMVYSEQSGFSCGTCKDPHASCPDNHPIGCYCHPAFVLNEDTKKCVIPDKCPCE